MRLPPHPRPGITESEVLVLIDGMPVAYLKSRALQVEESLKQQRTAAG